MLDDLHQVRSSSSEDVLGVVIAGVPEGSQFIATSRFEQPHVSRLRASGDTLELGVSDLALDADQGGLVLPIGEPNLEYSVADQGNTHDGDE